MPPAVWSEFSSSLAALAMKPCSVVATWLFITVYTPSTLCTAVCRGPYPAASLLRHYNDVHTQVPLFADLLLSEARVYAVINTRLVPSQGWHKAQWTLQKKGSAASVECASFGLDPHRHTLIVYADQAALSVDGTTLEYITIRGHVNGFEHAFEDVPLCPSTSPAQPSLLTACTSILSDATLARVPEWIAYNHVQGIQHSFIYVNDAFDAAERALRPFVTAGLATLVNWHPPNHHRSSFLYQQAQQNACLLRARGRSHWVALHDVDEFLNANKPWHNVSHFVNSLTEDADDKDVGAIEIKNWFYGLSADAGLAISHSRLVLEQCTGREPQAVASGREKLIVRPEHVHYVSVHMITLGKATRTLDPVSQMRLVHYKDVEHRRYELTDDSMREWVEPVQAVIDGVMLGG